MASIKRFVAQFAKHHPIGWVAQIFATNVSKVKKSLFSFWQFIQAAVHTTVGPAKFALNPVVDASIRRLAASPKVVSFIRVVRLKTSATTKTAMLIGYKTFGTKSAGNNNLLPAPDGRTLGRAIRFLSLCQSPYRHYKKFITNTAPYFFSFLSSVITTPHRAVSTSGVIGRRTPTWHIANLTKRTDNLVHRKYCLAIS